MSPRVLYPDQSDRSPSPVVNRPTAGAMLAEILPLIEVIPVAGPPAVFFAGAWILFALLLAGPFLLLLTTVAVLLLIAAIAVSPYLLVRHLRSAWARHATSRALVQPLPARAPAVADRALVPGSIFAAEF
jgi:hypothetical protein